MRPKSSPLLHSLVALCPEDVFGARGRSGEEWNGTNDSQSLATIDFSPYSLSNTPHTLPPPTPHPFVLLIVTQGTRLVQRLQPPPHTNPPNPPSVSPHKPFNNPPTPSISFHLAVSHPQRQTSIQGASPSRSPYPSIQTTACLKYTTFNPPSFQHPSQYRRLLCMSLSLFFLEP